MLHKMIKINLLDYHEEVQKVQIQRQVVMAASIVIFGVALIALVWVLQQGKIIVLNGEIAELKDKSDQLKPQVAIVNKKKRKIGRIKEIITGIETLRNNQAQPAKLLDDLNRLIPDEIWLERITQTNIAKLKQKGVMIGFEGKAEDMIIGLKGKALTGQAISEYVTRLSQLPYFKSVVLYKMNQQTTGKIQSRKFQIYCHKAF